MAHPKSWRLNCEGCGKEGDYRKLRKTQGICPKCGGFYPVPTPDTGMPGPQPSCARKEG